MKRSASEYEMLLKTLQAACDGMHACREELEAVKAGEWAPRDSQHEKRVEQRLATWKSIIDRLTSELDAIDPTERDVDPCDRESVRNAP